MAPMTRPIVAPNIAYPSAYAADTLDTSISPGQRYCQDCIQHVQKEPKDGSERKRQHTWAAAGHNFRSNLIFYTVPGNNNGKMSKRVYIDSILEPVVKQWTINVRQGRCDSFILEEDGDSGHGFSTKKSDIVNIWKQQHGLNVYKNCASSPNLALIESCWQPVKQRLRKYPH